MSERVQSIRVVDSHTGGEPTRVVVHGFPNLGNGTMADRLEVFKSRFDHLRRAIVREPRGYDAIVGALLCEPVDPDCTAGVIFFNNAGYLKMCGHGTIGLIRTLQFLNRSGDKIRPDGGGAGVKEEVMNEPTMETLARRVDKVERENRWLKVAGRSRTVKRASR